ncbi:50S ribosomal protein L30 [Candidatus Bathyarchaeota archaeon]|nr:MAG: 50S ribosomal protein L30 [Candidatus Bathyarchaeota archaeon]
MEKPQKCLVVIRIRGVSDIRGDIQDTLKMLNLNRNCNATIIDDRPSYQGMLKKAQSYITWGEPTKETVIRLLKERGRTTGNKKLTDEHAQKLGYKNLEELAEAIYSLKVQLKDLKDVKPVFRLHPPKKGYKGTVKKSWQAGGAAGYRGEAINDLIKRMT